MQNSMDISAIMNVLNSAVRFKGGRNIGGTRKQEDPLDREMKMLEVGKGYLQRVENVQDYAGYVQHMTKLGAPVETFPTITSEEQLQDYKIKATASAQQLIDMKQGKPFTMFKDREDGTRIKVTVTKDQAADFEKRGYEIGDVEGNAWKPLDRIRDEAMEQEKGKEMGKSSGVEYEEPYLDKSGNLLQKNIKTGKIDKIASPPKGMVIESDGQGGFTLRTEVPTSDLTLKTKGTVEDKILSNKEQFNRLKAVASEFKPEYQEIGARLGAAWTGIKAKLGEGVPKEDAKFLTDFKKYQRKAIENINLYIKEITGAQMSEKEADRLRLAQPDPGEKWYGGDDPITFKAKMDDVLKYSRAAAARYEYYRSKGFAPEKIQQMINKNEAVSLDDIANKMGQ